MPKKRYQDEIEEILQQSGESLPTRQDLRSWWSVWHLIFHNLGRILWPLNPGRVVLVGVSLLLLMALLFSNMVPGFVGLMALVGILLFVVGYGRFFVKQPKIEKRWRGRLLEYNDESWWTLLRRKLKR